MLLYFYTMRSSTLLLTRNFYQNHRKYFNSKDADQLRGTVLTSSSASNCDPVTYNRDLYVTTSINNQPLDPNQVAHPCGSMARSVFNGMLILMKIATVSPELILPGLLSRLSPSQTKESPGPRTRNTSMLSQQT